MGVTLQQIADMAGVHKSTVDKVIHNRPGVSDAKRQQIKKLLEENHYESNPLAKALNYQKKKMKIAVIMPSVDSIYVLQSGMELVQQDFNSFNIDVRYDVFNYFDEKARKKELELLNKEDVSGVILMPMELEEFQEIQKVLKDKKVPVVTIDMAQIDNSQLCCVGQDFEQEGRLAARMMSLLKPEGGSLGVISRHHMSSVKMRQNAFTSYLSDIAQQIDQKEAVYIQENEEEAYGKTTELLKKYPEIDSLFITCGRVPDICRAVKDQGREENMTIVCYESYPEILELIREGAIACSISSDLKNLGRLAMRLLFEYLIYDRQPEAKMIRLKNQILLSENI